MNIRKFSHCKRKKNGELFYDNKYMKCMRCTFVQYVRSFLAQYFKLVWYILSWGCWTYQTISLDFMRYYYRYQLHWFDLIHILNGQFIIITLIRFFFIRVKWKYERNQQCWEIEPERKKIFSDFVTCVCSFEFIFSTFCNFITFI